MRKAREGFQRKQTKTKQVIEKLYGDFIIMKSHFLIALEFPEFEKYLYLNFKCNEMARYS